jgi:hypothetical protein
MPLFKARAPAGPAENDVAQRCQFGDVLTGRFSNLRTDTGATRKCSLALAIVTARSASVRAVEQRIVVGALASALLAGVLYAGSRPATGIEASSAAPMPPALSPIARLEFSELLARSSQLAPSDKASSLSGQRVVIEGYMARLELAPKGAFYLASRPVHCAEAGGGRATLPPDSVLVTSDVLGGETVPFISGPLEISGVLDVGNRSDEQGRVAAFRLALDAPFAERLAQLDGAALDLPHRH